MYLCTAAGHDASRDAAGQPTPEAAGCSFPVVGS